MAVSFPHLSATLLAYLSPSRLIQYLDLYRTLRQRWRQQRKQGLYEILVRRVTARRIDATSICG